jgi:hypothetical protein
MSIPQDSYLLYYLWLICKEGILVTYACYIEFVNQICPLFGHISEKQKNMNNPETQAALCIIQGTKKTKHTTQEIVGEPMCSRGVNIYLSFFFLIIQCNSIFTCLSIIYLLWKNSYNKRKNKKYCTVEKVSKSIKKIVERGKIDYSKYIEGPGGSTG